MNMVFRELKANYKSLLIWCVTMIFLIYAGMVKYSAFAKTGDAVNEVMDAIPPIAKKIFGLSQDLDLTSVAVFYSIFFIYFLLLASVHGLMLGAIILSKEERDRTSDFLFVKPIKRSQGITAKLCAAMINVLIFDIVTYLISILAVAPYEKEKSLSHPIFLVIVSLFLIHVLFLSIGFLLASITRSSKQATSLGSFLIIGSFLIKILTDLQSDLDFLNILSPFTYVNSNTILLQDHIDSGDQVHLIFTLVFTILFFTGTYYFFHKKDFRI